MRKAEKELKRHGLLRIQDLIVLAVFVLALVASIVLLTLPGGETVEIYLDGSLYAEYDLSDTRDIVISTEKGTNTVKIENGKVFVTDADCPDKLCEKSRISRVGARIICAPHGLVVIITGKSDVDATTGGNL